MKRIKKFASTALALAVAMSMPLTAMAAPEDEGTGTEDTQVEAEAGNTEEGEGASQAVVSGALVCDPSVSIAGLQDGDSVEFYRVLKWDDGWKVASGFEDVVDSLDEIAHGTVIEDSEGNKTIVPGGISAELAGEIGKCASSAESVDDGPFTATGGSVVYNGPEPGLYMAIITAGVPGYFYNPVFVACDFNPDNEGGLSLSENELSYSDRGRAKVNKIDLEKEASSITADVGDMVEFTIETMIPVYANNYTNPVFRLTDVLSEGLKINNDVVLSIKSGEDIVALDTGNYTVTYTDDGYVIVVKPEYLKSADRISGEAAIVTYTAEVVSEAAFSVNDDENTVTLEFSNRPDDETGFGILRDRTNHYTFDIDGMLWGTTDYTNSEVVKVGVDANGNEITKTVELDNGHSIGALAGAKFTLYSDEECTKVYSNTVFNGEVLESDAKGHIAMKGLDAGTYWLKETEAPAGYIKSQDTVKIEIEVEEETVPVIDHETVTIDGEDVDVEVTYDVKVLKAYNIWVTVGDGDRVNTGSYELKNEGADLSEVKPGDKVGETEWGGKIINTVGVELPSTGGIGTTIFYVLGACLVVGAGTLLVVKKRVGRKE